MKKQYRIKKSKEIDAIIKKRNSCGNNLFVIYYKETEMKHFRFAISIGKKYGNAVERNLIKRQIRMIFQNYDNLPLFDFVVVVKPKAKSVSFLKRKETLENLILKTQEKEKINGSNNE